jgi:hypothetical protein
MIVFVGSGLSDGLYPSWPQLVADLCGSCGVSVNASPLGSGTPVEVLTDLAEKAMAADEEAFVSTLRRHFAKPTTDTKKAYQLLVKMAFKSYVTINFDPLLAEQVALNAREHVGQLFKYPDVKTKYLRDQNLFHIHGYIAPREEPDPRQLVLTRSAFRRAYLAPEAHLITFWNVLLTEYTVLFIACGLNEPELQTVFRNCKSRKELLKLDYNVRPPPLYILRPAHFERDEALGTRERDKGREEREQEDFRDLDVKIVRYDKRDERHSGLLEILEGWCPMTPMSEYNSSTEVWSCNE